LHFDSPSQHEHIALQMVPPRAGGILILDLHPSILAGLPKPGERNETSRHRRSLAPDHNAVGAGIFRQRRGDMFG
jgi:hypothetical protein